jgi:hypothetical protein
MIRTNKFQCERCGAGPTHAEYVDKQVRLWCSSCVSLSGHYEYCPEPCLELLIQTAKKAGKNLLGAVCTKCRRRFKFGQLCGHGFNHNGDVACADCCPKLEAGQEPQIDLQLLERLISKLGAAEDDFKVAIDRLAQSQQAVLSELGNVRTLLGGKRK